MKKVLSITIIFWSLLPYVRSQWILQGFVKDQQGQPYVHLEVRLEQAGESVFTDASGFYQFNNVPAGDYAISFDYKYDKEYRKVTVGEGVSNVFSVELTRRIDFEEVTIVSSLNSTQQSVNDQKLSQSQIRALQTEKDIPDILQRWASVQIQSDAGNGVGYSDIRVRGIDPQHIQYNLNGIPVNDAESSRCYLVDLPDLLSSASAITLHEGYVPGRSGPGAFGAAVDLFTNELQFKSQARIAYRMGSYNTRALTLQANSGLFEDAYNLEIRLSRVASDGFIDRSASKLGSLAMSAVKIKPNYSIRFNLFTGNELTGQAWNGLPYQYFAIDSLYRYNPAGTSKTGAPYANEVDDYRQTHAQFFYKHALKNFLFHFSSNYTRGLGYYENYLAQQSIKQYNLNHKDTSTSDLIRRKWLNNHFLFGSAGIDREWRNGVLFSFSSSWSFYQGVHYGEIIWSELSNVDGLFNRYYDNTGKKSEWCNILRTYRAWTKYTGTGFDFHVRQVSYKIGGTDDVYDSVNVFAKRWLFNPKIIQRFQWKKFRASAALSWYEREPYREDLLSDINIKKEKLLCSDFSLRYHNPRFSAGLSLYRMDYYDYLALSGKLSGTGDPLHVNVSGAVRQGIQFSFRYDWRNKVLFHWNTNLAQNTIKDFERNWPIYNEQYEITGFGSSKLKSVPLAYSPHVLMAAGIEIWLLGKNGSKSGQELNLSIFYKYTGSQYLDISGASSSLLPQFTTVQLRLQYTITRRLFGIMAYLQVNNIFDRRYAAYGWYTPYAVSGRTDVSGDPYEGKESAEVFFAKGLFPQAPRHWSSGLEIRF
ncbi:MAG: TonB-dependent receptor [Saprospiraceae bacterium]